MRELELNLIREDKKLNDIKNRLMHSAVFNTGVKRTKNKIINAINKAYELINEGKLKPERKDYEVIRDSKRLEEYVNICINNGEYVLDFETTGLNVFHDIIVGVCMYTPREKPIYIPVNHTTIDNVRVSGQIDEEKVKNIIKGLVTDERVRAINHNIKYDAEIMINNWGFNFANIYYDTAIGAKLLNENEENHKLKYLYSKYAKRDTKNWMGFSDYFEDVPFNYFPIDVAGVYGANDGWITYWLYKFQTKYINFDTNRSDMRKLAEVMFNIEMSLIPILIEMEMRGVEIDEQKAKELEGEYIEKINSVELELDDFVKKYKEKIETHVELKRLIGENKINYKSVQQLSFLLYDILELPIVSKKEPRGTGKNIVDKWLNDTKIKPELRKFIELLREYKTLDKLLTTYIVKIPKAKEDKTNAVHTMFNQYGARTGRLSSSHPVYKINLQNIPSRNKEIRKIFKARDGYLLISSDFSQIEPRTLASLSGDEDMIRAYRGGKDLYAMMGAKVYSRVERREVKYEECLEFDENGNKNPEGKKRRDSMKSVLLGIMYERGAQAIAEQFNQSVRWAENLINDFRAEFPKIELFRLKVVHQAETLGYVNTLFGRKRRLSDMQISDKTNFKYQEAHRQCLNAVIQGTAGDIMKLAMIRVGNDKRLKDLDFHLLITVHDELIAEVKEENVKTAVPIFVDLMKSVGEEVLNIPMKCDAEVSKVWYGAGIDYLVDEGEIK